MTGAEWFASRPGGLNRYFQSLYAALDRRADIDVTAVAFGSAPAGALSWPHRSSPLPVRVLSSHRHHRGPRGALVDRHFAPYGAGSRAAGGSVDGIIHFQGPWYAESLAAGQSVWKARLKKAWETGRYRHASRAVVLCEAFADILHQDFGYPRELISVIPPGVDLSHFKAQPPSQRRRPLVVCVRRLERRMGIDTLLEAWPRVLEAHPDAELSIFGDGTAREELHTLSERLGLQSSVRFHGRVSDEELSDGYRDARLTVVPTRDLEGFGLIALESLAVGRPVIVTNVGGLPDAVKDLDSSLIVPPESPELLADRLVGGLAGSVPSADDCRAHADRFGWDLIADRHVALYRELGE
ncbi:glycosyltransferase family 4 protein [Nocardioides sp. cx-173]|uniref:glycosyltransferase family 4 protein n=1 Tax=Nocardioides sp. cx-173 TaxID=2898796 RepID=UPI001E3EBDB6|nr:glycosyltransferase family 4 protein [Nocardioides sp. cx-173]MCD4526944.1 glycosyltransferase family 4 protein [Nocardioides sp. cx-173]UGB41268.1 glycosyltransferase family 4 protein [Nocardioides sp. cx-173]